MGNPSGLRQGKLDFGSAREMITQRVLFMGETAVEIEKLIRTRRTVHQYSGEKVADDTVHRALEMALWAPNHRLTFPWRFVVVGPETRGMIAELAAELKAMKKPLSETEKMAVRDDFLRASHLIILAMARSADAEQAREDYASVAAGVQNASLYLWDRGIGSKWTTGKATHHEKTYKASGVNPATEEIVGFLWIGYPAREARTPERPKLESVMRRCP